LILQRFYSIVPGILEGRVPEHFGMHPAAMFNGANLRVAGIDSSPFRIRRAKPDRCPIVANRRPPNVAEKPQALDIRS
jgi:hypothetical protein